MTTPATNGVALKEWAAIVQALALRVHRLTEAITVPFRDQYGGCTSWVNLPELPAPESVASTPALSDSAFAARLTGGADAIPGGFSPPDLEVELPG